MEPTIEETAVLLGLAEVKVPFRNLPADERISIVHICYRKLLHIEFPEGNSSLEDNVKCIGVVDSFYALQEVKLSVRSDGECFLYRKSEVILRHNLKDIIAVLPASDYPSRLIIVSRTQNFGRTLIVLQLQSKQAVKILVEKLTSENNQHDTNRNATKSNGVFRRGADSLGKVVGRKVNDLLSSFGSDKCNELSSESPISADESSVCPAATEEDDDDINSDSEQEDSSDSVAVKSVIINSLYEPRSSFDRNLLSPLEAEIQYLIQSETGFVDALKRLLDCKLTLQEHSSVVKKKHSDILFLCVEELYTFHKDLLEKIKDCGTNVKCISQAYIEGSENFRYHIHYIGNISAAEKIYSIYQEAFNQINLRLAEDLRRPRMRLNHYVLTFDSLKKICDKDDVPLLEDIILMFKKYLKEADTRLVTDSVVPCPINLLDYGYLIVNGELSLRKGEGLAKKHYHVLLLEQLLVLTRGRQESNEFVAGFLLKDTVLMHELRGVIIHLKVKNNHDKNVLLILKAKSVKLQQKWMEKLKIQIDLVQPKSKATLERQMCIRRKSDADLLNNLKITTQNTNEKFIMPPITMEMSFKSIYQNFQKKYSKVNLSLCMREIQETEKLLIRNMEHLLGQKVDCNMIKLNDIKQLYEFHLRYLYPAITFEKINFDVHVVNSIAKHSTNFLKYNECMLYHAAVTMYEGKDSQLISVFNIFLDNFFKYRIYLCNLSLNSNQLINMNSKDFQALFENIKRNLGLCLKYKYIPNIPSPFTERIIMEGILSVRECLGNVENDMYLIVTLLTTYFLSFTKESINIYAPFKNKHGKFGQPGGLKSFQVKFSTPDHLKRTFNLTALDVDLKNQWIKCFRMVLPRDIRIKRRAKSEERLTRNKLYSSVPTGQVSSSSKLKLKFHRDFMESHL